MLTPLSQFERDVSAIAADLKKKVAGDVAAARENMANVCRPLIEAERHLPEPSAFEVYQAIYLYLRGDIGPDLEYLYDFIAFGLHTPVAPLGGKSLLSDRRRLEVLLNRYRAEAAAGTLWDRTWFSILRAYYAPTAAFDGKNALCLFLNDTADDVLRHLRFDAPEVKTLRAFPGFLSAEPARGMAETWLEGGEAYVRAAARQLGISEKSWLWQDMTGAAITAALLSPDRDFFRLLPKLLELIEKSPATLDDDLSALLRRLVQIRNVTPHDMLKDFACRHWGNPKLAGLPHSKWRRADKTGWQLILQWVRDDYAKKFFETISARHGLGRDRLSAWLRYIAFDKQAHGAADAYVEDPRLINIFQQEDLLFSNGATASDRDIDDFIGAIGDTLATHKKTKVGQ